MTIEPPETETVTKTRISCDGGASSGHPRVWLQIDPETRSVECPYCDKKFILDESASAH
jgi:uncharacterized Zn-finger protein